MDEERARQAERCAVGDHEIIKTVWVDGEPTNEEYCPLCNARWMCRAYALSDLKRYKSEQDAMFAIQEEFEQAESYKRSEELATAHATIMKAALKTGFFDEDAAGRIALDLIGRCRPDLIPNQP
jgi:hypothetical protein